jgi:hypothetical protein
MISRRHLLAGAGALALAPLAQASEPTSFTGQAVFDRLVAKATAEGWQKLPVGELMGRLGQELLGTPYVAHTLELDDTKEFCTVNLDGLDCVTFFENSFALARILRAGKATPAAMLDAVRTTRYRGARQEGYTSRLHYTTDWIFDNVRRGNVRDLAVELPGAAPFTQKVGVMSGHPEAYRQLHAHPEWLPEIRSMEDAINARPRMFVPMAQVAAIEPLLQSGDIIGVATSTAGVDIAHTGLCLKDSEGVARFMDASSAPSRMKVTLERGPLHEAVSWSPRNTGIVVARPL